VDVFNIFIMFLIFITQFRVLLISCNKGTRVRNFGLFKKAT